jgi:hypothetical protein
VAHLDEEAGGAGDVEAEHAVVVVASEPVGDGQFGGPGPVERGPDVVALVDLEHHVVQLLGQLGDPLPENARPIVAAMAEEEDRVVLRCRPYSTFAQPPRHLYKNDQEERITHWVSATMPWDANDPAGW